MIATIKYSCYMRSLQQVGYNNVNSLKCEYEASSNIDIVYVTLVYDDRKWNMESM